MGQTGIMFLHETGKTLWRSEMAVEYGDDR